MTKLQCSIIRIILIVLIKYVILVRAYAVTLTHLNIINNYDKSVIILCFKGNPIYHFYLVNRPERLVLDIFNISLVNQDILPVVCSGKNLIRYMHKSVLILADSSMCMHFVFDLMYVSCIDDIILEQKDGFYELLLVVTTCSFPFVKFLDLNHHKLMSDVKLPVSRQMKNSFVDCLEESSKSDNSIMESGKTSLIIPIVVAIDAGHGGHDPGAKGYSGLYEKNITFAIATKLKNILDRDPMFHPFMIRDGDYFISVLQRSDIARVQGAQVLLSIHADAVSIHSKNNVRGASVWVLSDRRVHSEMADLLKKNIYPLKSFAKGMSNELEICSDIDPDVSRIVLDLQFCYSQKVGYEIALHILQELKNISVLHKSVPEYSSFAVLRAPDIPSILVETGFITHAGEEKLLASDCYQKKIAYALYKGLRSYFVGNITDVQKQWIMNYLILFIIMNI